MPAITLTRTQRAELDKLLRCGKTEVRLHRRSRMVLLAADKVSIAAIARELAAFVWAIATTVPVSAKATA